MKYCSTCGKQLQYDQAEICPECGCRIAGVQTGKLFGTDKIIAIALVAIFAVLCIIAFSALQPAPGTSGKETIKTLSSPLVPAASDSSLSVTWETMDDWSGWEHTASWSGKTVGTCTENGPRIVDGHGAYGTEVSLMAGSTESAVWRTFSDPSGEGWNTLTFVGKLSPCDTPGGRWMKIEVNDRVVFDADASKVPPGNGAVFSVPVHFPISKTVKVKISNGQQPAWGTTFGMDYYSMRLSLEKAGEA
jgi:hypothetical protein